MSQILERNYVNLTARTINIYSYDGIKVLSIGPSGRVARVVVQYDNKADGTVQKVSYTLRGFPTVSQNNYYIVEQDVKLLLRAAQLDKDNCVTPSDDVMSNGEVCGSTWLLN